MSQTQIVLPKEPVLEARMFHDPQSLVQYNEAEDAP